MMKIEPIATYRVQLNPQFTFEDAANCIDYLKKLGISHLYCSPYLQAAPGSTHGYDVVDHTNLNKELGGTRAFNQMCARLEDHKMSQVMDIVPNHMAITGPENPWWWDVLENGPSSRYASYFDVDWDPRQAVYSNLVLLPVLGDHYGRVLEAGDIKLVHDAGHFTFQYYDHYFPVSPRSLAGVLDAAAKQIRSDELAFIAGALDRLPLPTATDRQSVQRRHRDKEILRSYLVELCKEEKVRDAIDEQVAHINSDPDALDQLFSGQNYRVAFWRKAEQELGYRRFFDIHGLVGLHMEDVQVFNDTHRLIKKLVNNSQVDGLRIDHPDGLYDPAVYYERLQEACPDTWVVAEKILESDESLRSSWQISGTTGYDFLNDLNGIFVDPEGEQILTGFYTQFTGEPVNYDAIIYEKKHQVIEEILAGDLNRLSSQLLDICELHRRHRDYTRYQIQQALKEIAACFPVYRSYVQAETQNIVREDRRNIEHAVKSSKRVRDDLGDDIFDFIGDLLLLRLRGEKESDFVHRFQQFIAPVTAKGIEDTAFYCFNRFLSLNEVGGNPGHFGASVDRFHKNRLETRKKWPYSLLTSSTHDTKRSEDARARLNVLSEMPDTWCSVVQRWSEMNRKHKVNDFPEANTEYLLYQTIVGAWPISEERLLAYMEKAVREAKVFTSWTKPDEGYEKSVQSFTNAIMNDQDFIQECKDFVNTIIYYGRINSLAQTLVKLTAPGVPDIYQGSELWDISLVDPDNRRPVDFQKRRELLNELDNTTPENVLYKMHTGLPKMWVIQKTLALRKRLPKVLGAKGAYEPLNAQGAKKDHVIAFMRGKRVITLVPRFMAKLNNLWGATFIELPPGKWEHVFTADIFRGKTKVQDLLKRFPVCLLSRKG